MRSNEPGKNRVAPFSSVKSVNATITPTFVGYDGITRGLST